MDKKKVIENLKQVELYINKLKGLDYTQLQLLKSAIFRLHDAQDELKKSDWISVEDELPEYNEKVLVYNKRNSKDFWIDYRNEFQLLGHNFRSDEIYSGGPVTHWRKIDKLEE